MKLLVVVNNHNSFSVMEFCLSLRKYDDAVEVMVACDAELNAAHVEFFAKNKIQRMVFHLGTNGGGNKRQLSVVASAKQLESQSRSRSKSQRSDNLLGTVFSLLIDFALSSSLFYFLREQFIFYRLKRHKKHALEFIDKFKPDVVISISDRSHDYIEASTLWAAKQRGIKVLVPYVAQYDMDAALVYRMAKNGKPDRELRAFWPPSLYKIISYLRFKDQLYKGLFFQSPYVLNAHRRSGTLSAYPWWIGNGNSDVVCVDSGHTARKYLEHRVRSDKIVVVGHVTYDKVFFSYANRQSIKQALMKKYSLASDKKLLILSMPQYAEQGYMDWDQHWVEIDSTIKAVVSTNNNLLLSIHPRSDVRNYASLERKYQCRILEEPLSDVIGAADLFLASNSTTFTWAALCGIPGIALMSPVPFLFSYLESLRPVSASSDLTAEITNILKSPAISFEPDWQQLSRNEVFDGKFQERFLRLLNNMRSVHRASLLPTEDSFSSAESHGERSEASSPG
ncbi:hypothetical protein [Candidatus Methylomirabilis sp.]|uniref:hypothetical protein n=1 Tax=Candidatus Methylomirabilis sp. TaxID=2032687 RepID=UPI002A66CC0C|nr:hypothetical protein [Candidatus Methylomirabilis sp.]